MMMCLAWWFTGQVQVLSDHIEKLMMFLKHEATQKAKAHEQQRRLQKELELLKVSLVARFHYCCCCEKWFRIYWWCW